MDNSIGIRIKELRKSMNLTQQDLGDICGIHGSNIGRIENGSVLPATDVLIKMSIYFNVSCDYILMGISAKTQEYRTTDYSAAKNDLLKYYNGMADEDKDDLLMIAEMKYNKIQKNNELGKSSHSGTGIMTTEIA